MRGRHHAICGAAVAAPALLYLTRGSIGAVAVGVPIATLGAMLPDIDTRRFPLQGEVWRGWKRLAKTARARGALGMPFALAASPSTSYRPGSASAMAAFARASPSSPSSSPRFSALPPPTPVSVHACNRLNGRDAEDAEIGKRKKRTPCFSLSASSASLPFNPPMGV
ncbi:MAG: metal-dependent hydrolase [Thermomicrobia bacterium]|nr:metal-dependent hydrolase [Thermomicrobia bacterium]